MQIIKDYLQKLALISDEDWVVFSTKFEKQIFKKKDLIIKSGDVENYLSFIETGIVRFWIETEDKDVIFDFTYEKSFFSAYLSFLTRESTNWNIQEVTPIVLWRISYTDLQLIYDQTQVGEKIGRLAAENLFMMATKRKISLLTSTAEELYVELFIKM
ncbi:cyclic nucleotide-binding domain-containing protein [Chryseobacterium sp. C-39]|uniref:Cyclic nucleotide-binding domain-containing protein n=1 Tax=Chryseobacterium muglaense TaxID=2893752 RepID=A0A9Q3YQH0_9FLAO|nr:cyclic nucleotide-binding domain-containing protein [Chryseobacterium muglaense]MBD3906069.1 cyclic nucleotide-binding domain-containing protein [Chryseobacterium muglaense]MCC9032993.1 cyclic nucleotide-binding domain-containing protein [Chryseobacterium muglaense]